MTQNTTEHITQQLSEALTRGVTAADAADTGGAAAEGPVSLLIVDDDPGLLRSLRELLTLHGYRPEQALGGREAMARLSSGQFDIVLLDLVMGDLSGHQILEHAAAQQLDTKIIVVSGENSFESVQHALRCGAFGYVRKPYDPRELVATLETALRQRRLEL
ncbi:MAG: response regulator, partial [Gammaproteobacteria bacterium]